MKIKDAHPPTLFETEFPKFLYSKQGAKEYIVHLHWPKFVGEIRMEGEETVVDPHFLEPAVANDASELSDHLSKIMNDFCDFYEKVLNNEI